VKPAGEQPIDFPLCDCRQSPHLSAVHCMLCEQEPAVPGLFVGRVLPKEQALREIKYVYLGFAQEYFHE